MKTESFYYLSNEEKKKFILKLQSLMENNKIDKARRLIDGKNLDDNLPFKLSDIQESFLIGKCFGKNKDNVGCHVYFEFTEYYLDINRLNKAWNILINYHEMLNVIILPNRMQKVRDFISDYEFDIYDLRGKNDSEINSHFEILRSSMSHKLYNVNEWPLFKISITNLDNNKSIIHFSIDEWIIDGYSLNMLMSQWRKLYKNNDYKLPSLQFTFREYLRTLDEMESTSKFNNDLDYWMNKFINIPQGPMLSWNKNVKEPENHKYYKRKRYKANIEMSLWNRIQNKIKELGISETSLILMCFGELLGNFSDSNKFSIIITYFNRLPINDEVDTIVGPFVSTSIFEIDSSKGKSIREKLLQYQNQLWNDLDHSSVSGIRALRELRAREKKSPNLSIPIAFTSMLNNDGNVFEDSWLDKTTFAISQTPQVWMDHQVYKDKTGINLTWDVVEEYFEEGFVKKLFDKYIEMVKKLVEEDDIWNSSSLNYKDCRTTDLFNLSDMQQSVLFQKLRNNKSGKIYQEFKIKNIDVNRLENAINELIKNQDMLKTVIYKDGTQRVLEEAPSYKINVYYDEDSFEIKRRDAINKEFLIGTWPFFDISVCIARNGNGVVQFVMDSMIADGKSMCLLYKRIFELYKEPNLELPKIKYNYHDYIKYLESYKTNINYIEMDKYWEEICKNIPKGPKFPFMKSGKDHQFKRLEGKIENWHKLKDQISMLNIDLDSILFTVYTEVLQKWSCSPVFSVLYINWNRDCINPDIEYIIGEFTKLGIMEVSTSSRSFIEKVRYNKYIIDENFYNSKASVMNHLRKKMIKEDSTFSVVYTNYIKDINLSEDIELGEGLTLTPNVRLDCMSSENGDELIVNWDYNTSAFEENIVKQMFNDYTNLLDYVMDNLLNLDTVSINGKISFNQKKEIDFSDFECIHEVFENKVRMFGDNVAVSIGDEQIAYSDLNRKANKLANYLRKYGAREEVLIGICLDRSIEMIVSILAVLKSGSAYVPIDPYYPKERINLIIEDSNVPIIITQEKYLKELNQHTKKTKIICLERENGSIKLENDENLMTNVKPNNAAYVIYTSGSTGKPKGVLICHYNVYRLFKSTEEWYHFNENDVWTMFHSYAFDFSVWEIWGALLYGGHLVVIPYTTSRSPEKFYNLVLNKKVTVLNQTPTAFKQFIMAEEKSLNTKELSLRYIIFGGEALNPSSLKSWFEKHGDKKTKLINMYGITETTVHVTYRPLTINDMYSKASVIGEPIKDLKLYILDENLNEVPVNTCGELYVSGLGVARGYLNREQLTSERFIKNRFLDEYGGRLYRTGDIGKYLPNGDIEYLGRCDSQVKVRGFRIELGDIEACMMQSDSIKQAVVTIQDLDDPKIVAYIIPQAKDDIKLKEIRKFLRTKLPDYMIPNYIIPIEELALTENGKLDKKKLPWPIGGNIKEITNSNKKEMQFDITKELLQIFKENLSDNEEVAESDDIFNLGSTSITIMTIIQILEEKYKIDIPMEVFLDSENIGEIAKYINKKLENDDLGLNHSETLQINNCVNSKHCNEEKVSKISHKDQITKTILEIFKESIETTDNISVEDDIFDLGVTSITIVTVIQVLEEKYNIDIPVEVFLNSENIGEVIKYISNELEMSGIEELVTDNLKTNDFNQEKNLKKVYKIDTRDEIVKNVLAMFKEALDTNENILVEDDFFDLGATSITIVTIIQMIEEKYNISIPMEVFLNCLNLEEIINYLCKNLSENYSNEIVYQNVDAKEVESAEKETIKYENTIILDSPNFKDEAYLRSSIKSNFQEERVSFESLSGFLSTLRMKKVKGDTKYLYPSSGGRNAVQTYIYIKKDMVENIDEGIYYYHPLQHKLYLINPSIVIDEKFHHELNQEFYRKSAFMVFFISQLKALKPIYKNLSNILSKVDTGYMTELLLSRQADYNIGLCPVEGIDFEGFKDFFKLDEDNRYVYSLMGGYYDYGIKEDSVDNRLDDFRRSILDGKFLESHFENKAKYETIEELSRIQNERDFNILSKKELVAITKEQPHIRKFSEDSFSISLADIEIEDKDYILRSSQRHFSDKAVSYSNFNKFISLLANVDTKVGKKCLFTPPLGIDALDVYIYVKESGVESIDEGIYKYDRNKNTLTKLIDKLSIPIRKCHTPFNIAITKEAKFFIFLVSKLEESKVIFKDAAIHYSAIEAGIIGQLLQERQSEFDMGLVPIGGMDFDKLKEDFNIKDNVYIHSFMCGKVDYIERRSITFGVEKREEKIYPLSSGQKALFFVYQSDTSNTSYDTIYNVRIKSRVDEEAFKKALYYTALKHPLLRTYFKIEDGIPCQAVLSDFVPKVDIIDASTWSEEKIINENKKRYHIQFKLGDEPPYRVFLFKISEEEYVLLMNIHHIITDYTSTGIMMESLWLFYDNITSNVNYNPKIEEDTRYFEYIEWQNKLLNGESGNKKLKYWIENLGGELPVLNLPLDNSRPVVQTFNGDTVKFNINKEITVVLRKFAKEEKKTLYTVMLTAFNILLAKYSGQDDILVGTTANARGETRFADVFGYFINPIVIRSDLSKNITFRELLNDTSKTVYSALSNQDYPFNDLVKILQPVRDSSRSPIFQVTFQLLTKDITSKMINNRTNIEFIDIPQQEGQFDLEVEAMEYDDFIETHLIYNKSLFNRESMEKFKDHYINLLTNICNDYDKCISDYEIINHEEKDLLINKYNKRRNESIVDGCIHEVFEEIVEKNKEKIALVFTDECGERHTLTFDELNKRANKLAHYICKIKSQDDKVVGICMHKGIELLVSVIAVLKAGLAYIPIDTSYPIERRAYIISDSKTGIVIAEENEVSKFESTSLSVINIDTINERLKECSDVNLNLNIDNKNLAYILYTSGSTGKPKGVKVQHEGPLNTLIGYKNAYFKKQECKIHLQMANYTFDVFVGDFLRSLCLGQTMVICPYEYLSDPKNLYELIRSEKIEFAEFVPAVMRYLVNYMKQINKKNDSFKALVISSDSWNMKEYREFKEFFNEDTVFINAYGVTEASIDTTYIECNEIDENYNGCVPIGRPFVNAETYILDKYKNIAPQGIPGELCIGGKSVTLGYLNREDLTSEKFISNKFTNEGYIYRTGDLVRYNSKGIIEFLGRIDNQIKIRGLRVELGEIENKLVQHKCIKEAVVIAKQDKSNENILIGFYIEKEDRTVSVSELKNYLKEALPEYMVPSTLIKLDKFPTNSNDKVDRKALKSVDIHLENTSDNYIAPTSVTEKMVAKLWSEMLEIDKIGLNDNFFDIGGHSFLAIKLINEIEKVMKFKLKLSEFLMNPTIKHVVEIKSNENCKVGSDLKVEETNFLNDANLPLEIQSSWYNPKKILLTGATGHLGINLLVDLLKQYKEAWVYCLVRGNDIDDGAKRIKNKLIQNQLWNEEIMKRIIPVIGNLEEAFLGMKHNIFDELSREIDVIYHNGAYVNFAYPYEVLKNANVEGTKEVVRLATNKKMKLIHYISTTSVYENLEGRKDVDDNELLISNEKLENTLGYTQSKWVAERIIRNAMKRGIPVTIYRPDVVTGSSKSGVWNSSDYASKILLNIIKLGIIPEENLKFNWIPVDYVSKVITYISAKPDTLNKMFNLVSPNSFTISKLGEWLTNIGYPVEELSIDKWCEKIDNYMKTNDNEEEIPSEILAAAKEYNEDKLVTCISSNLEKFVKKGLIEYPTMNEEIIRKYVEFYRDQKLI
ncbi:amino acid adenylation domain-containing protein [Clostridium saccharoperbutylacetonicum]